VRVKLTTENIDLKTKGRFHLFYLAKPWPQFRETVKKACRKAYKVSKIHSDVKLINDEKQGKDAEVDFQKILGIDYPGGVKKT
jgi:hypothetical protein